MGQGICPEATQVVGGWDLAPGLHQVGAHVKAVLNATQGVGEGLFRVMSNEEEEANVTGKE